MSRRRQIFLSHASADEALMHWVKDQVEAVGVIAWVAENHENAGDRLSAKILAALQESDAMIVLFSARAHSSAYVQQEVGAAVSRGIPVVALVDKGLGHPDLGLLAGMEYIEYDPADLAAISAPVTSAITHIASKRGIVVDPSLVPASRPALQLSAAMELNLTPEQVLLGLAVLALAAGLVYLAVQSAES